MAEMTKPRDCYHRCVTDQALKWWHVRWRLAWNAISRPASILGRVIAVLCLCAAIGYGVLYTVAPWIKAQVARRFDPRMSLVPVALSSAAKASLVDGSVDCYGFGIPLPKTHIDHTAIGKSLTIIYFHDEGALFIDNPENESGLIEVAANSKDTERLVGQDTAQSKFKLMNAALRTTPDQVKPWLFRSAGNKRAEYLLGVKDFFLLESGLGVTGSLTPIYSYLCDFRGRSAWIRDRRSGVCAV